MSPQSFPSLDWLIPTSMMVDSGLTMSPVTKLALPIADMRISAFRV